MPEDPISLLAGPILYARGADTREARLTAVVITREGETPPELLPEGGPAALPQHAATLFGHAVWRYEFALPARRASTYRIGDETHPVNCDLSGDLRFAFVSCNGQENGDEARGHEDRDVLWRRLLQDHRADPLVLLVHGGDQLYADEAVESHRELARWHRSDDDAKMSVRLTGEMSEALRRYFFGRYLALLNQPAAAALYASVPSLMIWDDHDICDGWGSHPHGLQNSAVGQALFATAREMFLLFQLGGAPEALPATVPDRSGESLTTAAGFPGFHVILPDLRSERTPTQVMGTEGWDAFTASLAAAPDGERRFVISSVPTLGPRLSLLEALLDFYPGLQSYEDDLRDQWQSRAHRAEWRRWLAALERQSTERGAPVTVISGEIHLAGRGTMVFENGETMHQLIASGITHPEPPRILPLGFGALSRLGETPLEGRPIRIHPLPGQRFRYTAQRNFLVVKRKAGSWSAAWELEHGGRTASLAI